MNMNQEPMTELAHHQSASSLNYQDWDLTDVQNWLGEHLRLPQYKELFGNLRIDGSLLDHINDQDLQNDFNIQMRLHRVKIIEGIKKLQNQAQALLVQQQQHQQFMGIPQPLAQAQLLKNQNQFSGMVQNSNPFMQPTNNQQFQMAQGFNGQAPNLPPPLNQVQSFGQHQQQNQQQQQRTETPPHNNQRAEIIPTQVIPNQRQMSIVGAGANNQVNGLNEILVLKAVEGQLLNNVYIVGENGASLGRHSASNDIVISESFVSRRHCEIKYIAEDNPGSSINPDSSRFYIRDIGSTTGSFIMVRQEILLKQNMMFQMGLSEFKVIMTSKKTMIELHVFEGPAKNKIFTVDDLGCGIGRDQSVMNYQHQDMYYQGGNTFCVKEDSQMSNHHARITFHKGGPGPDGMPKQEGFYLADVGSTNRTWLRLSSEGEQSNLHPLKVNDILKIGSTVFVVQTNDIGSLKNMPIINKRVMGGPHSEEEKNAIAMEQLNPGRGGGGSGGVAVYNEYPGQKQENADNTNQVDENQAVCKICYENEPDAAFIPCGHNFACVFCAQRCSTCPVCRTPKHDVIKLYKDHKR